MANDWEVREAIYRYLAGDKSYEDLLRALPETLEDLSRVGLAIEYIARGGDPEKISSLLSWRDFEEFVSKAMEMSGMEVARGIRAPPPRGFEIDVLGVDRVSGIALMIDCKHWGRVKGVSGASKAMIERAGKALSRCDLISRILEGFRDAKELYLAIVTLRETSVRSLGSVFIVPIYRFRDFLQNIEPYSEELGIEPLPNPCFSKPSLDSYLSKRVATATRLKDLYASLSIWLANIFESSFLSNLRATDLILSLSNLPRSLAILAIPSPISLGLSVSRYIPRL